MFNPKRQVRECTNQVLEFDTYDKRISIVKCKGMSIGARKNHVAAAYKGSMVVYGGQTENGLLCNEMLVFHMESFEWCKIPLKGNNTISPFVQGGVCSVIPPKHGAKEQVVRKSD